MYLMFFSIFSIWKNYDNKKIFFFSIIVISITFLVSTFSPLVIKDMVYDLNWDFYYEDFGNLFIIFSILYILNPIIVVIYSFLRIKNLTWINKVRFFYILLWYNTFIFNYIFFLALLPTLWIWIFQIEQIIFFIPFIILSWYSLTRYFFTNFKIWFWKFSILLSSIIISFLSIKIIKFYYITWKWSEFNHFWRFSSDFWIFDLFLWIVLFFLIYNYLNKKFLWYLWTWDFEDKISKIRDKIPFITNINDLNKFIKKEFKNIFKISYAWIKIEINEKEIQKFFSNYLNNLFINDIVFIEENKNKFKYNLIKEEIEKETYLVFPLRNNKREIIWILEIWKSFLNDNYTSEEIDILKEFSNFLEWHLKYLKIYEQINDLNLNLDRKIDEKTIEYNNLINKQKEFISVLGHEVKSPLWAAIFQTDCIIDDIEKWEINKKYIIKELNLLNSSLIKSGDLLNNLFSIERFENKKIKLFKEKINIIELFKTEINIFSKINPQIKFSFNTNKDRLFIEIDKIQFRQVVDNLIWNAIKFSNKKDSKINIEIVEESKNIVINIEDNWIWFENIDISNIFDKYSTWETSWIWLWMWLYLCKKIVELHSWEIKAENSKHLWWAKFTIEIPKV